MLRLSVVIPTFYRNKELERVLESCTRQQGIDPAEYEIIVVDNSPDGQARNVVGRFAAEKSVEVRYLSEPRPGISHARNAGVATARGELVAFVDDDGEAHPDWLATLLSCYQRFHADLIWGAILPRFDGALNGWDKFYNYYFTRRIGRTGATPKKLHGTNNSCVRKAILPVREPFHPQLGLIGGSDMALFRQLEAGGRKFVYCAEAIVFDHIPVDRMSYRYLVSRNFWQGQHASYMHTLPGLENPKLLGRSMAAGCFGIARFGCLTVGQVLLGRWQSAALASLNLFRAAGKVIWMRPFRKQRYGIVSPAPNVVVTAGAGR